jgi:hypothetical protein
VSVLQKWTYNFKNIFAVEMNISANYLCRIVRKALKSACPFSSLNLGIYDVQEIYGYRARGS